MPGPKTARERMMDAVAARMAQARAVPPSYAQQPAAPQRTPEEVARYDAAPRDQYGQLAPTNPGGFHPPAPSRDVQRERFAYDTQQQLAKTPAAGMSVQDLIHAIYGK